ncbi:MAG: zf-HC2 domain-containing protein [Actinomycetota bacterium]|nr:zf-HC2 domain-containing protein [Actinomycetota bacterium]
MNCERAELALSERMDGERLAPRLEVALERHLADCSACRGFEARARRVREGVRFRLAEAVPDLVEPIMERVAAGTSPTVGAARTDWPALLRPARHSEQPTPPRPADLSRAARPGRAGRRRELARVAVALLAGAFVGTAVTGTGIWPGSSPGPAVLAADLPGRVLQAATHLQGYHARFAVTEWHFQPRLPLRHFSVDVWLSAPERFRMDVADLTPYPNTTWPRNDLSLIVNRSQWYLSGPGPCPADAWPNCPLGAPQTRRVDHRVPFSEAAPMPSDIVLPLTTLADANRLDVLGRGTVGGRPAVRVALTYRQAGPLFAFLRQGGAWRPFYPDDRVVLWLDRRSWFPLAYRVYPADEPDRVAWAARQGLPTEPPGQDVFSARVLSFDERVPSAATFSVPDTSSVPATSEGAQRVKLDDVPKRVGYAPIVPTDTAGLHLYRVVIPPGQTGEPGDQTIVAYSSGLAWLKVRETHSWRTDAPFGPVSRLAERVDLPGGGVAYYEPATRTLGRRLSIHAHSVDLFLETNLSRDALLHVAGSLPVASNIPASWDVQPSGGGLAERLSLRQAVSRVPFPVSEPESLPAGYRLISTEVVQVGNDQSVNLYFGQPNADLEGQIRLHIEPGTDLPPASAAEQSAVQVGDVSGRFTPSRDELEWVDQGIYYSIDGAALTLADLLVVAQSLQPVSLPRSSSPEPTTPPATSETSAPVSIGAIDLPAAFAGASTP